MSKPRNSLYLCLTVLAFPGILSACSSSESSKEPEVTYTKDIAPLLAEHCVSCHRDSGSVAPFALDNYEAAKTYGGLAKAATAARQMPPWNMDDSGSCQTFQKARWLKDEEIAKIAAWVDAGMPKGEPQSTPLPTPSVSKLEGEVLEVHLAEPYTPVSDAGHQDDYRCFLIDPKLDHDQFVTAYDVRPGDPETVHHVVSYVVDLERAVTMGPDGTPITNRDAIAALQSKEARPGWPCYGGAGDGIAISGMAVPGWAPGVGLTEFPWQTGLPIRQGEQLILQVHYHVHSSQPQPDLTTLQLKLADSVPRRAYTFVVDRFLETLFAAPTPATLPPGSNKASFSWSLTAAEFENLMQVDGRTTADYELVGVYPHMHQTGRQQHFAIQRNSGKQECGAEVSNWNFNWQQYYFYEKPMSLDDLASLSVTCDYDTSSRTEPTYPGFNTENEMCLLGFFLTEKTPSSPQP